MLDNVSVKAHIEKQLSKLHKKKIATAEDVLLKFTAILNQELTEEKVEINPLTGEYITIDKKPTIAEVIRAGVELMKRYPTNKELERINLEIEKMKQSLIGNDEQDDKLTTLITSLKEAVRDETS